MYYTFKSNKIYPVIKAGKKYFKKVDHFAPVSPNAQVRVSAVLVAESFYKVSLRSINEGEIKMIA